MRHAKDLTYVNTLRDMLSAVARSYSQPGWIAFCMSTHQHDAGNREHVDHHPAGMFEPKSTHRAMTRSHGSAETTA